MADPNINKLLESLRKNPTDLEIFKNLEQYCLFSSEWEKLSQVYSVRSQAIEKSSPEESAELYFKQGECFEKRLANHVEALECYEKSYRLSPDKKEYFDSLISISEGIENWEKV